MASTTTSSMFTLSNQLPVRVTADQQRAISDAVGGRGVVSLWMTTQDAIAETPSFSLGPLNLETNMGSVLVLAWPPKSGKVPILITLRNLQAQSGENLLNLLKHIKRKTVPGTSVRSHNRRLVSRLCNLHPWMFALYKALIELQGLTLASGVISNSTLYWGSQAAHLLEAVLHQPGAITEEVKKKYTLPYGFDTVARDSKIFHELKNMTARDSTLVLDSEGFEIHRTNSSKMVDVSTSYSVNTAGLQSVDPYEFNPIDYVGFSIKKDSYSPVQWLTLIPNLHFATTITMSNILGLTVNTSSGLRSVFDLVLGDGKYEMIIESWKVSTDTMRKYLRVEEEFDRLESQEQDRTWKMFPKLANLVRDATLTRPFIIEKKEAESKDVFAKKDRVTFAEQIREYLSNTQNFGTDQEGKRLVIYIASSQNKDGTTKVTGKVKPAKLVNGMRVYPPDAPLGKSLILFKVQHSSDWPRVQHFASENGLTDIGDVFKMPWSQFSDLRYTKPASSGFAFSGFGGTSAPQQQQQGAFSGSTSITSLFSPNNANRGTMQAPQQQQTGLFSGFGAAPQQQAPQTSTFTGFAPSQQQAPPQTSIFAQPSQQQTGAFASFAQPQQQQQQAPPQTSSIFAQPQQQQAPQTGAFSFAQPQPQQQQASGLFSNGLPQASPQPTPYQAQQATSLLTSFTPSGAVNTAPLAPLASPRGSSSSMMAQSVFPSQATMTSSPSRTTTATSSSPQASTTMTSSPLGNTADVDDGVANL